MQSNHSKSQGIEKEKFYAEQRNFTIIYAEYLVLNETLYRTNKLLKRKKNALIYRERKLEKRLDAFEIEKEEWYGNHYPQVCNESWYMRHIEMSSSMCYVVSELPEHIKSSIGSPALDQIHHREFLVLKAEAQQVINSIPGGYVNKIRVPLDHYDYDEKLVLNQLRDGVTDTVSTVPEFLN